MRCIEECGCYPRPPVVGVDVEPIKLSLNTQHDAVRIGWIVQAFAANVSKSDDFATHLGDQYLVIRIPLDRQISRQHPMPTIVAGRGEPRTVEEVIRHQASVGNLPCRNVRGGNLRSVARPCGPNRQSHLSSLDDEAHHAPGNLSSALQRAEGQDPLRVPALGLWGAGQPLVSLAVSSAKVMLGSGVKETG
jgi:hypothetical protein